MSTDRLDAFNIEDAFRKIVMGKPVKEVGVITTNQQGEVVGRITFGPQQCDYEVRRKLDDAKDILQHIRNNWDKEDFDGEEVDRKIDDLLGKIR